VSRHIVEAMPTPGKLELMIKINEFPADVKTVENGWKQFEIDCNGQIVTVTVKPKVFKKLEQATGCGFCANLVRTLQT